jgi:hypothetical protein
MVFERETEKKKRRNWVFFYFNNFWVCCTCLELLYWLPLLTEECLGYGRMGHDCLIIGESSMYSHKVFASSPGDFCFIL